jgi:hypothetical protein
MLTSAPKFPMGCFLTGVLAKTTYTFPTSACVLHVLSIHPFSVFPNDISYVKHYLKHHNCVCVRACVTVVTPSSAPTMQCFCFCCLPVNTKYKLSKHTKAQPNDTASHTIRLQSSATPPQEPQTLHIFLHFFISLSPLDTFLEFFDTKFLSLF